MISLLDEEGTPSARQVIGSLLAAATHAEIAVSHVRLGAIDLVDTETGRVQQCRVLLDRLDAGSLASLAGHAVERAERDALALLRFITSDRVELRSAGISSWRPDFSIYRGLSACRPGHDARAPARTRAACLVGAHYFGQPPAAPAFTCLIDDAAAVDVALRRFEQLWLRSHDVSDVVIAAVARLADAGR
jgi:hypothetical protein